ncbi:prolyl aminopeptidase, partial [mine drainage metagenome]
QANRAMVANAAPALRARLRTLTRARAFDSPEYANLVDRITAPFQMRFLTHPHPDWTATRTAPSVYRAMMTRSGDEFAVDGTLRRWDGRRYYRDITVPTLVLAGKYDVFLTASIEMDQRIEPAHLRILPRSSHLAILEQPREFLGTVREFLNDVTGD